jgi:hypothetical protein
MEFGKGTDQKHAVCPPIHPKNGVTMFFLNISARLLEENSFIL